MISKIYVCEIIYIKWWYDGIYMMIWYRKKCVWDDDMIYVIWYINDDMIKKEENVMIWYDILLPD